MTASRRLIALAVALGIIACQSSTGLTDAASVRWNVDAYLCGGGSRIPFKFKIDGAVVFNDTLTHLSTRTFATTAGTHHLEAVAWLTTVKDTSVVLTSRQSITVVAPVYCS